MESFPSSDRVQLPRNMIENSMFEEEPDVVDLAKEPSLHPLEPDEVEYEPRSSRLLVRGLGDHEMDEDEEDYESSSAKLLGMSFMNRSTGLRSNMAGYRQRSDGSCSAPSVRTTIICAVVLVIAVSVIMAIYLLPKCTFTKEGCHNKNHTMEDTYHLATNGKPFPWAHFRLPEFVVPTHYDIVLQPNLTTMRFTGSVQITVEVIQVTMHVILHSSKLNITKVTFVSLGSSQPKPADFLEYPMNDQIAIIAPEALLVGHKYKISIEYSSNLSDTYSGFYKIAFKNNNSTSWLAATQFEPLSARAAFPCFDEPAFKASFQVKINREDQHIALSNMPKKSTNRLANGLFQDEFFVSLKMSTYLVAVIVGNFKCTNKKTNGIVVSVYAVPQKLGQTEYALNTAVKLLEFYQNYFNVTYPFNKIDLVALPDFQAAGMENWGLITFRETALLYDNNTSSAIDKKRVTAVIAHELAHQWFGNLVTMEWWNDLWLNEGFATFMENLAMKIVFPDLYTDDIFLNLQFKTMEKDSMNSSHPVSLPVNSSEEIEQMFDVVSYIKGSSLLFMLKNYLHKDVFQTGIQIYLHDYSYNSTCSDNLWDSMNKVTHGTPDVKTIMNTWTIQKGFPLVTVKREGKKILLKQERFVHNTELGDQILSSSYLWQIPLSYITNNDNSSLPLQTYLLDKKTGVIEYPHEIEWVKFNVNGNGYYIVHYDDSDWIALIQLLKTNPSIFDPKDRANLIHNIFILAGVGKVSLNMAFNLVDYIVKESSTAPIMQALYQIRRVFNLVEKRGMLDLSARVLYRIEKLFGEKIDQETWNNNKTLSELELQSILLNFACSYDLRKCHSVASDQFKMWKDSNGTISLQTNVMKIIFTAGAKTEDGWQFLLKMYSFVDSEPEKLKILESLASTSDVKKLIWLMQTSLQGIVIRTQDLPTVIKTISQNLPGHLLAWDFVKENWDHLIKKFHRGSYTIQSIVTSTTNQFSTLEHLLEVKSFFESKSEETAQLRYVREAIETIQLNIQWMEKNLALLEKLL
ncbi:leucyl-cystinyl aminopeptidase isoform X1 [Pituophis catenifer annectens]|uniref:leucyl-cystinyl aminopeptidase isoform X1 n=2 Tax=Pituophis catenifer annectens TaxID=94852 RepID=UPI00399346FF